MKVVTSRENAIYKSALKLLQKKHRDRTGQYLLEGRKPLRDALDLGLVIEKVFVCNGENAEELEAVLPEHALIALEHGLFARLSDTEHSQGVIAVIQKDILDEEAFAEGCEGGNIAILDRLQDPGNVGTIIRTAEAAGFSGVIATDETADPYGPKAVRASSGALLRMPVLTGASAEEAIAFAKERGCALTVTDMDGEVSCFDLEEAGSSALVIGNEGRGASASFREEADITVHIPMAGRIESLNAAVAAGIVMYCLGGNIPSIRHHR